MRALDNIQGGYEVLDLSAGKKCTCEEVIPLPVAEDIIKRVESWAKRDRQSPHDEPSMRACALFAGASDDYSDSDE